MDPVGACAIYCTNLLTETRKIGCQDRSGDQWSVHKVAPVRVSLCASRSCCGRLEFMSTLQICAVFTAERRAITVEAMPEQVLRGSDISGVCFTLPDL